MRWILMLVLATLALSLTATPESLLRGFGKHVELAKNLFKKGETADVYALLMKMKIALNEKDSEEGIPPQLVTKSDKSCTHLMNDFIEILKIGRWHKNITGVRVVIDQVASKCTSSDYQSQSLQGFNDNCALCTVILRVMDNYVAYHDRNISDFLNNQVCGWFDGLIKPTCEAFIHYAGPVIIDSYLRKNPADITCLKIGLCKNTKCRITSFPPYKQEETFELSTSKIPSWDWIMKLFTDHFGNQHFPVFDMDNDSFSDVSTFRGYNWKGPDCNQLNPKIYPGRKTGNKYFDHDCNGIYGVSNVNNKPYESLYCDGTTRLGVAVIGDSAGAHFCIPEKYFNASMIKKGTYKDLLTRVADELDLPHQSGYTGHSNTEAPTHSVYKYLRNWNLCNNNDYQNLGVNGGSSGNTWGNIKALKRDSKNDHPMLIFMQLIGNDVCAKSFDGMTTVDKFKVNVLKLLNWVDSTVPSGSHVWIFGLADGDILFDNLANLTHPLQMTYGTMYNFLNCLKISPCWGWLNTNETVRKFTTERAKNLSKVYQQIINQYKFKNFDIVYYDFPQMQIITRRVSEGGDPTQMIQPADGFHPGGLFNSYLADWIWEKLVYEYPDWIGAKNPHNKQILQRFHLKLFNDTKLVNDDVELQKEIEIQS